MSKNNKIISVIISFIVVVALSVTGIFLLQKDNKKEIDNAILKANEYIEQKELDEQTFSNVLQSTLNGSLVYNTNNGEYLIVYRNEQFLYKKNVLTKSDDKYNFYNNISDALENQEIGNIVLTKGYYKPFDGGNSCFVVENYAEDESVISFANQEKTYSLVYLTYDNIINIYQMGYKKGETLENYVNRFTNNLAYANLYVPNGQYKVVDNFDIGVSNKNYWAYEANIYSDDTYLPTGYNNGCLFYVYNYISNVKINGFHLNIKVNKKLDDPLCGLLVARNVDGLELNNCSIYYPKEGHIYGSSGVLDLFTGWKNVRVKNCRFENYASTVGGGGIGVRDIYQQKCENALFENNYLYSNCRDEVIAIFSGVDTSLGYTDDGNGLIQNVIFKNNKIVGGATNLEYTSTPRVVGITIGYQKSPVKDITFVDNDIEMYCANYFMLYGKAENVKFENNRIKSDASFQDKLQKLVRNNPYADSGYNISFTNNNVEMVNDSCLYTIAETGEEAKFVNNTFTGKKIYRVFDSLAKFENNTIKFDKIEACVYHQVKTTHNNTIIADALNVVYEFYNLNVTSDILIDSDTIQLNTISRNFMMFNGTDIKFNGFSVTFRNLDLQIENVLEPKYYYLAYGTDPIQDSVVINFENCSLSVYEDPKHNMVVKNDEQKVVVNFINKSNEEA